MDGKMKDFMALMMDVKPMDDMKPGHHGPIEGAPAVDKDPVKLLETIHTMISEFLMEGSADSAIKEGMDPEKEEPEMEEEDDEF